MGNRNQNALFNGVQLVSGAEAPQLAPASEVDRTAVTDELLARQRAAARHIGEYAVSGQQ